MHMFCRAYQHGACRCKYQVTVFAHSCRNSMQPGAMPSSAKQGLNGIYFSSGCFQAELRKKWLCLQFWGFPACNRSDLLSVAKVTGDIAAASQQMCFILLQPMSAQWPGLQSAHTRARADSSSEVANTQLGAEDHQKCLMLILTPDTAYVVQLQLGHNGIAPAGSAQSFGLLDLPPTCKLDFQQTQCEIRWKWHVFFGVLQCYRYVY